MHARSSRLWLPGLCATLFIASSSNAAILRVKADAPGPTHDGTSWGSAYTSLPAAAAAATDGDEIWVAQGTYVIPVVTSLGFETGARYVSVKGGVSLYGGFGGYETARDQRAPKARATTIDGTVHLRSIGQAPVTVDGFTITHGTGVPILLQQTGAYDSTGVTRGAGIYVTGGTVNLSNNTLAENRTAELHWSDDGLGRGSHTRSSGEGGGIYVESGTVLVEGNLITDNSGVPGGGICAAAGQVTVSRNVITGNLGEAVVGAVQVSNNLIAGNGGSFGSAIKGPADGSAVTVTNNTIAGNTGIICLAVPAGSHIVNNVIVNAWQDIPGTPASLLQTKVADFRHNCVYLPGDPDAYGYYDFRGKNGNLDADPQFIDASGGDYRLRPGSPCIDAGDDALVPAGATDLDGNPRIKRAHVDIGAYEAPAILHVKADAPGPAHDGKTWTTAFLSVQEGINAANAGDEVWVAGGTYRESIVMHSGVQLLGGFDGVSDAGEDRDPKANTTVLDGNHQGSVVTLGPDVIQSARVEGFTIQAGYGTELGGHRYGGGLYANGATATIANNIITDNEAGFTGGRFSQEGDGGGLYAEGCTLTVTGNTFFRNGAGWDDLAYGIKPGNGGGLYLKNGTATVAGNTIKGNIAQTTGAGLYATGTTLTLTGNEITGNHASVSHGGAYIGTPATVTHNRIIGNAATPPPGEFATSVGGLGVNGGEVRDNLIVGNLALNGGGLSSSGNTVIVNNTVAGNQAMSGSGAGIAGSAAVVANNIVGFNEGSGMYVDTPASIHHNDVFGNTPANWDPSVTDRTGQNGNISVDPLFVDRAAGQYRLLAGSPAIDAGDSSLVSSGETDLNGGKRVIGAAVDMGADEAPLYAALADAALALKVAGGLSAVAPTDITRLDVVTESAGIDACDAARLARKAMGLDP